MTLFFPHASMLTQDARHLKTYQILLQAESDRGHRCRGRAYSGLKRQRETAERLLGTCLGIKTSILSYYPFPMTSELSL